MRCLDKRFKLILLNRVFHIKLYWDLLRNKVHAYQYKFYMNHCLKTYWKFVDSEQLPLIHKNKFCSQLKPNILKSWYSAHFTTYGKFVGVSIFKRSIAGNHFILMFNFLYQFYWSSHIVSISNRKKANTKRYQFFPIWGEFPNLGEIYFLGNI